jgi:hypothetical protein
METPAPTEGGEPPPGPPHPIRIVVSDDLARSRVTIAFRLLLAIPHLIWVALWGAAAMLAAIVIWLAVLFEGRSPRTLHGFVASYLRYATHVNAYVFLAANPFPSFTGSVPYPVDLEIDPPARQNRWSAGFRLLLALPALVLAGTLSGGSGSGIGLGGTAYVTGGVLATVAFLGWFAALARARMPQGLRDLGTYSIGYGAQTTGYLLLLTGRYPDSDPSRVEPPQELPPHAIRLELRDELRRSRTTAAFRFLLAFPHFVWVTLWSIPATVAVVVGWFAALALGRLPHPLHRFLAAYVRYWSHLTAFLTLVGGPFPGFAGTAGRYPVDIEIEAPVQQGRLSVLFRALLVLPALFVASALGLVLLVVAVLGWFAALAVGRMPRGLRDIGATCTRYQAQTYGYLGLVTPQYPYACPAVAAPPAPPPAPSEQEPAIA